MQIYEELVRRGLIAQVTDEQEIRDLINNGKARFYIGFDCTADSLTAGHFMALTLMKRLQMAGNQPVALIGGGTTMIGDPSGRTDMRKMLTKADIDHNAECFRLFFPCLFKILFRLLPVVYIDEAAFAGNGRAVWPSGEFPHGMKPPVSVFLCFQPVFYIVGYLVLSVVDSVP